MRMLMTAIALLALASPAAAQTACRYYEGSVPTEDDAQKPGDGSFAVFGDRTVTIHWANGSKDTCKFWFDDTMLGTVDCFGKSDAPRKSLLLFGGSSPADTNGSSIAVMNGVFWFREPKCAPALNLGM